MVPHEFTKAESWVEGRGSSPGFVVGVCLSGILALYFIGGSVAGSEAPVGVLPGTLNPNTAPAASLLRLPRIGLTRAQTIVAFRRQFQENTGQDAPFGCPGDLQQIKGIGPRTVEDMAEWLRFDQSGRGGENQLSTR